MAIVSMYDAINGMSSQELLRLISSSDRIAAKTAMAAMPAAVAREREQARLKREADAEKTKVDTQSQEIFDLKKAQIELQNAQIQQSQLPTETTQVTSPTTTSESTSSSETVNNYSPAVSALIEGLISNTAAQREQEKQAQDARQQELRDQVQAQLSGFSKEAAFADAKALMDQLFQSNMEKHGPAVQKAVEGAGVSGSSMAALLTEKYRRDSAQQAAALGATQAVQYGQIGTNLSDVLTKLIGNKNTSSDDLLTSLLGLAKGGTVSRGSSSSSSGTRSGGTVTTTQRSVPGSSSASYGNATSAAVPAASPEIGGMAGTSFSADPYKRLTALLGG